MPRSSKQALVWANGDQTSEGVIVDTDGTEALIELSNGQLDVRQVKDLQPTGVADAMARVEAAARAEHDDPANWTIDPNQRFDEDGPIPSSVEVLHCQAGHTWTRQSQRGRKPHWCPEHVPVEDARPVQTLHCKHGNGHEWTRPSQRGKKPEYCPAHRPTPAKPVQRRTEAPSAPSAPVPVINDDGVETEAPIKVVQPKQSVDEILTQFHPDPETVRKLQYIDGELRRGRESNDVQLLIQTQASIIRRLRTRVSA